MSTVGATLIVLGLYYWLRAARLLAGKTKPPRLPGNVWDNRAKRWIDPVEARLELLRDRYAHGDMTVEQLEHEIELALAGHPDSLVAGVTAYRSLADTEAIVGTTDNGRSAFSWTGYRDAERSRELARQLWEAKHS